MQPSIVPHAPPPMSEEWNKVKIKMVQLVN
jgi:hypothetical protein